MPWKVNISIQQTFKPEQDPSPETTCIGKYARGDNLLIVKFLIYATISAGTFLTGCMPKTEGTLELKGRVIDETTKAKIPGRDIIVQGLVTNNNNLEPIDAGQFSADSSGYFTYSMKKIKDARFYNFKIVGDSVYSFKTILLGLYELEQNAKYLSFSVNRLADLTLKIQKINMTSFRDTLYLSLVSDGADFRTLYPYKIENYGITDNSFDFIPALGLRWIGGNIKSTVKTRVIADKMTKIHWELVRNKKRKEFNDTLTCHRNITHTIYFTY